MQNGETALYHAAKAGRAELVQILIEAKSSVTEVNKVHPHSLIFCRVLSMKSYVYIPVNVCAQWFCILQEGNTALTIASENGHKATVDVLLEHGSDVDHQNEVQLQEGFSRILPSPNCNAVLCEESGLLGSIHGDHL